MLIDSCQIKFTLHNAPSSCEHLESTEISDGEQSIPLQKKSRR